MIVKICGIKNARELEIVERYADFGGIVVMSESKRCVELKKAKELIENSTIPIFAVSTCKTLEEWEKIISMTECSFIQVHGSISVDDFEVLKNEVTAMKAFIVDNNLNKIIEEIEKYKPHLILLDSGMGSGKIHDWNLSREVAKSYPIILAGGLKIENVVDAVKFVKPIGVDVSSGVENGNFKDEFLVSEFVRRVKNAFR